MKKSITALVVSLISLFLIPTVTFAAGVNAGDITQGIGTLATIINKFTSDIVKAVGALLMAGAVVIFFYGIVEYILGVREGSPDKIKKGNDSIMWGVVALFVMFSIYGIIKFGQNIIFNNQDINTITIPELNFVSGKPAGDTKVNNATGGNGQNGTTVNNPLGGGGAGANNNGNTQDGSACTFLAENDCTSGAGCSWQNGSCVAGGGTGNNGGGTNSGGRTQTGDAICMAYGDGTGCTTSSNLSGVCTGGICQPKGDLND